MATAAQKVAHVVNCPSPAVCFDDVLTFVHPIADMNVAIELTCGGQRTVVGQLCDEWYKTGRSIPFNSIGKARQFVLQLRHSIQANAGSRLVQVVGGTGKNGFDLICSSSAEAGESTTRRMNAPSSGAQETGTPCIPRPDQYHRGVHHCAAGVSVRIEQAVSTHGRRQKMWLVKFTKCNGHHTNHEPRANAAASATRDEQEKTIVKEYIGCRETTAKKNLLLKRLNKATGQDRTMQDLSNLLRVLAEQEKRALDGDSISSTCTTTALLAGMVANPDSAFVAVLKFGDGQRSSLVKLNGSVHTDFVPGEDFVEGMRGA